MVEKEIKDEWKKKEWKITYCKWHIIWAIDTVVGGGYVMCWALTEWRWVIGGGCIMWGDVVEVVSKKCENKNK